MTNKKDIKDKQFREWLKEYFEGWTDEDIDALSEKQLKFLSLRERLGQYKVEAEVVYAKGCAAKPKIGDKIVFTGTGEFIAEETTFPFLCVATVTALWPLINTGMDRIIEGLDPNGMWRDQFKCRDMGVRWGMFGEVVFKLRYIPRGASNRTIFHRKT